MATGQTAGIISRERAAASEACARQLDIVLSSAEFDAAAELRQGFHVTYDTGGGGVKLSSSGATYVGNYEMSAKAGLVLQAEHLWDNGLGVLVRVVNEEFRVGRSDVEGRHLGVGMSYRF